MTTDTADPAAQAVDPRTLALLRNDLAGLSKATIGELVAELTARMGVDPALAPIDILPVRRKTPGGQWVETTALYVNARGASEIAKLHDLSDVSLEVDIRDRVVIVQGTKTTTTGRTVRDVGAAAFDPDKPADLARAVKMATTSCHRRTTLRAVGIFLNEPPEGEVVDA